MKDKILLITGFEPFGGEQINPSWKAVLALPEQIGPWKLCKLQLPTVFEAASLLASARADEINADAILCIGQAGGRRAVTPEYVAINLRHAGIADNEGNMPREAAQGADGL